MPRTVLRGGEVFDGTGSPAARADVVVEDGLILEVGPDLDADEAVDVTGRTLLPGLFDCHTHVMVSHVDFWRLLQVPFSLRFYEAVHNLSATLGAGITTIRDAGGADLGVKEAVERGLVPGPRMQISIGMISQTGGHGDGWMPSGSILRLFPVHPGRPDTIVDGLDEMRRKVRELIRYGADVIKVATSGGVLSERDHPHHPHFTPAELDVLVAEARAAGIWVMAHAQAADGIKNAVRAGIRSIEHGIYLDDEAIDLMLEAGTFLVPTLVAPTGVLRAAEEGAAISDASRAKAEEVVEAHRASFRRAVEAGVRVALGTDSGVTPHGENLAELPLMVAGGMAPAAALRAATRDAAELLGLEDRLGTIEPGKLADVVVVRGDPLDVESLPKGIEAVFKGGVLVSGTLGPAS